MAQMEKTMENDFCIITMFSFREILNPNSKLSVLFDCVCSSWFTFRYSISFHIIVLNWDSVFDSISVWDRYGLSCSFQQGSMSLKSREIRHQPSHFFSFHLLLPNSYSISFCPIFPRNIYGLVECCSQFNTFSIYCSDRSSFYCFAILRYNNGY